jgi:spermidine synthase
VLDHPAVRSLVVVEFLPEVIAWHRSGALPAGERLRRDPRCRLVRADVFAVLGSAAHGAGAGADLGPFDAILLDVDHSPEHPLHPAHAAFYAVEGLARARERLRPGGVLGIWAAGAPSATFPDRLRAAFPRADAHVVRFRNVLNDADETHTIYVAGT